MMMSGNARVLTSRELEGVRSPELEARERIARRRSDGEAQDDGDGDDVDAPLERADHALRVEEEPHRLGRDIPRQELLRVLVDGIHGRERRDGDEVDRREDEDRDEQRRDVRERTADPDSSQRRQRSLRSRGVRSATSTTAAAASDNPRMTIEYAAATCSFSFVVCQM